MGLVQCSTNETGWRPFCIWCLGTAYLRLSSPLFFLTWSRRGKSRRRTDGSHVGSRKQPWLTFSCSAITQEYDYKTLGACSRTKQSHTAFLLGSASGRRCQPFLGIERTQEVRAPLTSVFPQGEYYTRCHDIRHNITIPGFSRIW